ncbi:MAG TPA: hypothetical protein VFV05_07525 [Methylomirabilota bacterium]|nr:hypothetical protein [Methylomirabilota bacterium]
MPRLLIIVERNARRFFDYVRDALAGADTEIEVIEDRRTSERRADSEPPPAGRRGGDRRKADVGKDLKRFGWAIVKRRDEDGPDEDKTA